MRNLNVLMLTPKICVSFFITSKLGKKKKKDKMLHCWHLKILRQGKDAMPTVLLLNIPLQSHSDRLQKKIKSILLTFNVLWLHVNIQRNYFGKSQREGERKP